MSRSKTWSLFQAALLGWALIFPFPGLAQDGGGGEEELHQLKLDLAPLLDLPALWACTPSELEAKFAAPNFRSNPYLRWEGRQQGAKDLAVFTRRPFANVAVDLGLWEGAVPVERAMVEFRDGKVLRIQILVSPPSSGPGSSAPVEGWREVCVKQLNALTGALPAPLKRDFGSGAEAGAECQVWRGATGLACLDHAERSGLLRLSLAPATADVASLASIYIQDAPGEKLDFFFNLDTVLAMPTLWDLTPAKVEEMFASTGMKEPPYYQWLTADKGGVRFSRRPYGNVEVDLSLFNRTVPVEEVVIDFINGKAAKVAVSLYNRGDSGDLVSGEFEQRYKTAGVALGKMLSVRPTERKPNAQTAVKISGWIWNSPGGLAALEYNTEALLRPSAAEFLRLKLAAPAHREAFFMESGQTIRDTALGRSDLPRFVKRDVNGDVYVGSVPMVDQGAKGYCVVASCQRLFSYLQIPCDQHELARIAGSDADRGTSSQAMEAALKKIDSRFKVNFKPLAYRYSSGALAVRSGSRVADINEAKFQKLIQEHTSRGVPLLWALVLGIYPEQPQISLQAGGGHMRLILGYNEAKREVIFTDSWGAGHELKRMKLDHAYQASVALYVIEPKGY